MRVAIVTGASSGMGREFVLQIGALYKNLDEIWVIARRKGNLERVAEQSRLPLRIFDGDLLKKPVYKAFCEALCEDTPDIRMLVSRIRKIRFCRRDQYAAETDPDRHGWLKLPSFNKNDPSLPSLHASWKPDRQSGIGSSLLSTTVFCGLCGNEILCAELFPFAQRRA